MKWMATTPWTFSTQINALVRFILLVTSLALLSSYGDDDYHNRNHHVTALSLQPRPVSVSTKNNANRIINDNEEDEDFLTVADRHRRRMLTKGVPASLVLLQLQTVTAFPQPVHAVRARGAAELDLEYYARSLVGGNKKEGNVLPSKPPPVPPPRTLKGQLLTLLLNNECNRSCIPVQAMIQQIIMTQHQQKSSSSSLSSSSAEMIANRIQQRVNEIRESTRRGFYTKTQWLVDDVSDQYYFDFTAYALWKTASELIPVPIDRDRFVRLMGQMLFNKIMTITAVPSSSSSSSSLPAEKLTLVDSTKTIIDVLQLFQSSGFCKGYKIRTSDSDDDRVFTSNSGRDAPPPVSDSLVVFDDLDDESLDSGGTTDCLVSIYEPATLGAALQINGEQSRIGPDFIGPTLAAAWDVTANAKSSWEIFFVDPQYRPNPKDYFPNEKLIQYTLSRK